MEKLIADIEQDTLHTAFMTGIKQIDQRVLDAMRSIDRRAFVRKEDESRAYEDHPLDIGFGQTISQPFIVALMIHLIEPKKEDKVLEVGSGSGYLLAVLAKLCREVYGIELVPELAERSKQVLVHHKLKNTTVICGDGNEGLKEHAPFDKIIVSAAAHKLPNKLLDQLAIDGILVLPKSISPYDQVLMRVKKTSPTEFSVTEILPVRFVPFINS